MGGYEERSPHHVRLQPTECEVAFGKSWRQACDPQLWDRYSWVRRARRCHDSGVRPPGNGACILPGGCLYSIRVPRLRGDAQNGLPDGDLPAASIKTSRACIMMPFLNFPMGRWSS